MVTAMEPNSAEEEQPTYSESVAVDTGTGRDMTDLLQDRDGVRLDSPIPDDANNINDDTKMSESNEIENSGDDEWYFNEPAEIIAAFDSYSDEEDEPLQNDLSSSLLTQTSSDLSFSSSASSSDSVSSSSSEQRSSRFVLCLLFVWMISYNITASAFEKFLNILGWIFKQEAQLANTLYKFRKIIPQPKVKTFAMCTKCDAVCAFVLRVLIVCLAEL